MSANPASNAIVIKHPILSHHLTILRDVETPPDRFRRVLGEVSRLLVYESTRDLDTAPARVRTPLEDCDSAETIAEGLAFVSIMRAGNGMLDSALHIFPFAQVGHIGIYRDKFIKSTVEYFFRLPKDISAKTVVVLDPLLATGDTAAAAIQRLKDCGVKSIRMVCLLAAPEGLARLRDIHPEVPVYCLNVERGLNDRGYILPGMGDAGDRLYGTI